MAERGGWAWQQGEERGLLVRRWGEEWAGHQPGGVQGRGKHSMATQDMCGGDRGWGRWLACPGAPPVQVVSLFPDTCARDTCLGICSHEGNV